MALVVYDRVQETTATTGTGSITLAGAVAGYQSFAVVGNTNTTFYCIVNGAAWEVGIGTYSTTGPTLARTTVLSNSNGNTTPLTLVGASNVFCTYPSEKSVNLNASGNVSPLGTIASGTWQGTTVGVAYGGTGVTTSSGANSVVLRDANSNITGNNFLAGYTAIVSAGGTTVLTVASTYYQRLSGTLTQTFQLPDATTLPNGTAFVFDNDSTGVLTVTDNASATVDTIPAGALDYIFLEDNSTSAGSWGMYSFIPATYDFGTSIASFGNAAITNATWNGNAISSGYGGTGLTTFTAANYALYSTSASALTAGTLPVAAGGTGLTSTPSNGTLDIGNGTGFTRTTLTGTASQVTVTNGAGAITLSLPSTINVNTSGSAGSVTNVLTLNNGGAGAASGTTYNGSTAQTISYNTIGASPLAGSTSLTTLGTVTAGTWNASVIGATYGGTGVNNGANTLTLSGSYTLNQSVASGASPTFTGTNFSGTASSLSIGGNAATAGYINGTNIGRTGSNGFISTASWTSTDWANQPVSGLGMTIASTPGAPNTNYGFFNKFGNRDAGGPGWGGMWMEYDGSSLWYGTTVVSTSFATWKKVLDTSNLPGSGVSEFVSGTVLVFYQAAAPTGWTQVTTQNDAALRVVSTAGGGTGGTVAFTTAFAAANTTDGTALTTAQLPAHNHGVTDPTHTHAKTDPGHAHSIAGIASNGSFGPSGAAPYPLGSSSTGAATTGITITAASTGITIQNTGSGSTHNHTLGNLAVKYINTIICSKN